MIVGQQEINCKIITPLVFCTYCPSFCVVDTTVRSEEGHTVNSAVPSGTLNTACTLFYFLFLSVCPVFNFLILYDQFRLSSLFIFFALC